MVADESYKKYLDDKLELIFNDNGVTIKNNLGIDKSVKSDFKDTPECDYITSTEISPEEVIEKYPTVRLEHIANQFPRAVKLPNGIMGVRLGTGDWYFPELDFIGNCNPQTVRLFKNGYFSIGSNLFNKSKSLICSRYESVDGEIDLYDNNHFLISFKGKNTIVDLDGHDFQVDGYPTSAIEPRKQCILLRDGDAYYEGIYKKRYKVLLKNGILFDKGANYSVIDDSGLLSICHNLSNLGQYDGNQRRLNLIGITDNGSLIDNGDAYNSFTKLGKNIILAKRCGYYQDEYYLFNEDGKKIIDNKFISVDQNLIHVGNHTYIKAVGQDKKRCIFNEKGELFSGKPHDYIELINEEYAKVKDDKEYRIVNKNGIEVHNNKGRPYGTVRQINNSFLMGGKKLVLIPDNKIKKANVRRHFTGYSLGYTYEYDGETIYTKYQPIMIYNKDQALLLHKNEYVMFNRKDTEDPYENLGYFEDVKFNDSFIESKGHILFPYNGALLDITDFYKERLKDKKTIRVNQAVGEVLTKKQYIKKFKPELDLLQVEADIKDENEKQRRAEAQKKIEAQRKEEAAKKAKVLKEQEEKRRIQQAIEEREKEEKRISEQKASYLSIISDAFEKLEELHVQFDRIPVPGDLFDWKTDHYEIKEDYVNYLRAFDLSQTDFNNVKVSGGINFKGSNARIDPQQVYNKNMSGSDYTGLYFSPFADFTMANICGSKFSFDDDDSTIDVFNSTIKNAIYDDDTKINEMPVDEFFETEKKNIANKSV